MPAIFSSPANLAAAPGVGLDLALLLLAVLLACTLTATRRAAWRRGFAAGAARSADLVSNGFHNPSHPIHQLYKK